MSMTAFKWGHCYTSRASAAACEVRLEGHGLRPSGCRPGRLCNAVEHFGSESTPGDFGVDSIGLSFPTVSCRWQHGRFSHEICRNRKLSPSQSHYHDAEWYSCTEGTLAGHLVECGAQVAFFNIVFSIKAASVSVSVVILKLSILSVIFL